MRMYGRRRSALTVLAAGYLSAALASPAAAVGPVGGPSMTDLQLRAKAPKALATVPVPQPTNLKDFVRNKTVAIALGKALLWDQQVGSDGQACASCHFHAGADSRAKNQVSTGFLDPADPGFTFETTRTGGGGPNYTLRAADFPYPKYTYPWDKPGRAYNDVTSSMGVYHARFDSVDPGNPLDNCTLLQGDPWRVDGILVRRVEPRHTPTMINAVFNHRNFWDGRANNIFNGVDPFGHRTNILHPEGRLYKVVGKTVVKVNVEIDNASLASQAVGPPLSPFEMSCEGRTFPDLGKKMLSLKPLAGQAVAKDDSVLSTYRDPSGYGLKTTYKKMIQDAFMPAWYSSTAPVRIGDKWYSQMEGNFSLFFGLAVQLYEATLVSDRTPFDDFAKGDPTALTPQEKLGLEMFLTKGRCINCHTGPEFTDATVQVRGCPPAGNQEAIERMFMAVGKAIYDGGFYNVGVRRTTEDLGVGGLGPDTKPLSFAKQVTAAEEGSVVDRFCYDPNKFQVKGPVREGERVAADGAFKTPGLRNVGLTAPYFHNGGKATLQQVVDHYDQGGRGNIGFAEENFWNLDPDIQPIGFTAEEEAALVAFLNYALTDPRVDNEQAPFDHPALKVPNGAMGDESYVWELDHSGRAVDDWLNVPAVGRMGRAAKGLPQLSQIGFDFMLAPPLVAENQ